ncbi:polysaccharide biosynthesis/export family protein [Sphingobium yanoikuyae]|jgi:polysaccharide export outer membrane protein|uniref:Polysaccharide export protein n=2 Tax=Sphingobium yanoikuyae TaxID=13690 RepID=A0A3G2UWC1_SPHYA|nr:polysaccharide biosynthesis/export family protein [Sphingobium yanoikuyae]AYO79255.1 polysaccharide export protein [Sphingobium yanoikuyae]MDV3481187.1 polysaccharide biosynthesis/export family protein [Sphingobium yanoikuyae]
MRELTPAISARAQLLLAACSLALAGCSSLGASGPTSSSVKNAGQESVANAPIKVVDLNADVASRVMAANKTVEFAEALGDGRAAGTNVGLGDALDIAIWEAPPASLFGTMVPDSRIPSSSSGLARSASLPEQMVDTEGRISIPFAGSIQVVGLTPQQVGQAIVARLRGKAHNPQVVVRLSRVVNNNVTVVGDVSENARVALTPKGERLLDVLASVGGVKQPVGKTLIQITRGAQTATMPLEAVIKNPRQNIRLQSDDIVTALFQPFSFTALGATGNSAEINFEGTGLTMAQALGRVGGLRDDRADVRGVFIFRLERPEALDPAVAATAQKTPDGKIPVIYRLDLKNPASFFIAQGFPVQNKDVLYISNAPLADIQKFVNIISQMAFSIININNTIR